MKYSYSSGTFTCEACGHTELDTYGKILSLTEINPGISYMEISACLGISFRELNEYIKDGYVVNPLLPG